MKAQRVQAEILPLRAMRRPQVVDELLTLDETCRRHSTYAQVIYFLCAQGEVRPVRYRKRILYPAQQVVDALARVAISEGGAADAVSTSAKIGGGPKVGYRTFRRFIPDGMRIPA